MSTQEAVVTVLIVGMVVGVPLMALAIRFSLKPVVDAWIRLRERQGAPSYEDQLLRERVATLERVLEQHGLMEHRAGVLGQPLSDARLPAGLPERTRA